MAYGAFLRRLGRRRLAAEYRLAAHANLIRLGAEPYLERCDRELVACGLWPAKRRGRDRTRLTPQERSVASPVASGLQKTGLDRAHAEGAIQSVLSALGERLSEKEARDLASGLPRELKPRLENVPGHGRPYRADDFVRLVQVAEREGAGLVVVGRRGRGVVAKLMLGSVSHELTNNCSIPLPVVTDTTADAA
jgi:nucleotide-binding universal stress UspA family protein